MLLLTSLSQALLPSSICPKRFLINMYSANGLASEYGNFSITSSSRIGLPFSVVFSGSHPYLLLSRSTICLREPGLNSSVIVFSNGTSLT